MSKMSPDKIYEALSAVTIPQKEYLQLHLSALPIVTGSIGVKGRIYLWAVRYFHAVNENRALLLSIGFVILSLNKKLE